MPKYKIYVEKYVALRGSFTVEANSVAAAVDKGWLATADLDDLPADLKLESYEDLDGGEREFLRVCEVEKEND